MIFENRRSQATTKWRGDPSPQSFLRKAGGFGISARGSGAAKAPQLVGDLTAGAPPVPIPNTEVKPRRADCTARESVWESRSLPALNKGHAAKAAWPFPLWPNSPDTYTMAEKSFLDRAAEYTYKELERVGGDPSKLEVPLQTVAVLYSVQAIIDNGGFQYLFENDFPFSPPYSTFSDAYRRIGASQDAERLDKAVAMFPFESPHLHQQKRLDFMGIPRGGS
jgi:hypothetical protein